jgi:hypothetical protein
MTAIKRADGQRTFALGADASPLGNGLLSRCGIEFGAKEMAAGHLPGRVVLSTRLSLEARNAVRLRDLGCRDAERARINQGLGRVLPCAIRPGAPSAAADGTGDPFDCKGGRSMLTPFDGPGDAASPN